MRTPRTTVRKRITVVTAIVCVLSLVAGSFAFFTDRETQSATAVAGNMDLVFYDISASSTGANGLKSNNEFALDKSWQTDIVSASGIINPGDFFDMSYKFVNEGSKSMDVRQQLVVTSDKVMTEDAEEYQLYINPKTYSISTEDDVSTMVQATGPTPDVVVKVSDDTPSGEGAVLISDLLDTATEFDNVVANAREVPFEGGVALAVDDNYSIFIAHQAGAVWTSEYGGANTLTFPEPGLYLLYPNFIPNGAKLTIVTAQSTVAGVRSDDGKSMTYTLDDITLNGSVETEDGVESNEEIVLARLGFLGSAKNAFMDSNVTVTMTAQAKQHRNTTDADWVAWGEVESKYEQINNSGSGTALTDIYWDGNTDGLLAIDALGDGSLMFCKVSDQTPTKEQLLNATMTVRYTADDSLADEPIVLDAAILQMMEEQGMITSDYIWIGDCIVVVNNPNTEVLGVVVFPEPGIYFVIGDQAYASSMDFAGN